MSLTLPQFFDKKKDSGNPGVLFYYPAAFRSRATLPSPTVGGLHYWRNFAHPDHRIGNLNYTADEKPLTITEPFCSGWNGSNPANTGKELILHAATPEDTAETVSILIAGVYNNATGFYFRFGEETPGPGQGNVIIDSTNITVTRDDGVSSVAAHGKSWLSGERFLIGVKMQAASPLVYSFSANSDVAASGFVSAGVTINVSCTIADEFNFGVTANLIHVTAALIARGDALAVSDVQALYDQWRKGDFVLPAQLVAD